jgi:hypothetical protein
MAIPSRRTFNKKMLSSLAAYGLIETLFMRRLLGDTVRPLIHHWMADLNALSQDVKGQKIKDIEFQTKLEELYKRVDLPELIIACCAVNATLVSSGQL